MESALAVLLRAGSDGSHANATMRLALKVDQLSIQMGRQPIVVPKPGGKTPIMYDLLYTRNAITISGIIDNIGTNTSNTTANEFFNMDSLSISGQTYYIPYKNYLEKKLISINVDDDLQLEIGDATTPDYAGSGTTASTGGGIYFVRLQQCQFSVSPSREDRWNYSMSFVSKLRVGAEA